MSKYTLVSEAKVSIERPERYAKQLASHMGHRVPFEKIGDNYEAKFGDTLGQLEPGTGFLLMRVSGSTPNDLTGPQAALEKHLRQFAKDQDLIIEWKLVA